MLDPRDQPTAAQIGISLDASLDAKDMAMMGRRLKKLRIDLGLTVSAVAAAVKVDRKTIYSWEKGIPSKPSYMPLMNDLVTELERRWVERTNGQLSLVQDA